VKHDVFLGDRTRTQERQDLQISFSRRNINGHLISRLRSPMRYLTGMTSVNWRRPCHKSSFLAISSAFLLGFEKVIVPLNSVDFSMSDRTDEISLWNHKFVLVWLFLHFFYICGTEGTSSKCTLFIGTIGLQYKVFRQAVRRIPKEPPFWLWLR